METKSTNPITKITIFPMELSEPVGFCGVAVSASASDTTTDASDRCGVVSDEPVFCAISRGDTGASFSVGSESSYLMVGPDDS